MALKQCSQMITHSSTPCQIFCWPDLSQGCFLEVSDCSSQTNNSLKSHLWRSIKGCNWEQMRRPVHASMVMSTLVEGKSMAGGEKWKEEVGKDWGTLGKLQCRKPLIERKCRMLPQLQPAGYCNAAYVISQRKMTFYIYKKKKKFFCGPIAIGMHLSNHCGL